MTTPCTKDKAIDMMIDDLKEIKADLKETRKDIAKLTIFRAQVMLIAGVISAIISYGISLFKL